MKYKGSIVLVGVNSAAISNAVSAMGHTVYEAPTPMEITNTGSAFDVCIVAFETFQTHRSFPWEKIYFLTNRNPIGLLIRDADCSIHDLKGAAAYASSAAFDFIFAFNSGDTPAYQRIERWISLNIMAQSCEDMQEELAHRQNLESELTFKEMLLNHEQGVFASLIASITSGLVIIDCTGNIVLLNDQASRLLHLGTQEILGSSYRQVFPQEMHGTIGRFIDNIRKGDYKTLIKKINHGNRFFDVNGYCIHAGSQQAKGILLLINDVTEQEQLNRMVYQTEKLSTVGTMLFGVAHELRNPLSIISACAQKALNTASSIPQELHQFFSIINNQTNRCATTVNTLLNLSRTGTTVYTYHRVSDIMEEVLTYLKYQNSFDRIEVKKNFCADDIVYGDRSRFVQVFLNLVSNALDAMNGAGILTLSTEKTDDSSITIEINDTGHGISNEIKGDIFDPFFTTKDAGKSTGLGLTIVHKILHESNGTIRYSSTPGHTSFFVRLPSKKDLGGETPAFTGR